MPNNARVSIGIWSELGPGSRWANEGVSRVFGFLIEGAAKSRQYVFHLVVQQCMAESVRADLRTLSATEGVDWLVHEPSTREEAGWRHDPLILAHPADDRAIIGLASFANERVSVEGWVVTFPHYTGALHLTKPKAVLMPDALPYDFPLGWKGDVYWGADDPWWVKWRDTARRVLAGCDTVITFSKHVATRHVLGLLNVPEAKIRVIPLAPPDLADILPFVRDRRQTPESRELAAEKLRVHVAIRRIAYLRGFPFEQISFAVTTTQDRPTKNLGMPAEAVRRMVRERRSNIKLFTTASINFGADWTLLPDVVERSQFHHDLVSIPDVPRDIHAALFHCATLTIHPSYFEGIVGTLPFFESVSLGTPCIMARGPHVEELLETEPDLRELTFDPYDIDQLADLIVRVEGDRESAIALQSEAYERLSRNNWSMVAEAYAEAAVGGRAHSPSESGL